MTPSQFLEELWLTWDKLGVQVTGYLGASKVVLILDDFERPKVDLLLYQLVYFHYS